jgi:hypothetical protein
MTFPTHQQAPKVLQPCKQTLDFPPASVAPEFPPVLAVRWCAITTMRCNQLDPVLLGKKIVQRVAVISPIRNQSFGLLGHASTPQRCHCWNRRWQVWYGPYRWGRSCHGAPVRNTHNMPSSTCRACRQGRPRLSARRCSANSTKGLIRFHCTSVRSAMPLICFKFARDSSVYSRATFMR